MIVIQINGGLKTININFVEKFYLTIFILRYNNFTIMVIKLNYLNSRIYLIKNFHVKSIESIKTVKTGEGTKLKLFKQVVLKRFRLLFNTVIQKVFTLNKFIISYI